jgi:hypothetical protein
MIRLPDGTPDRHRPQRTDATAEALEHQVLRELSRRTPSPDLTRKIMGRLGYMKATPHVARRRRIRRWVNRLALCAAALIVVVGGARVHESGPYARRPAAPTIPKAIGNDVSLHQQRIKGTIRMIRTLAPTAPSRPDDALDEEVDRSAIGPFRWL